VISCDIAVIGGGPAGSATALLAARAGLRVVLADRAVFPRHKACAEYLSPEAARDLDALGVSAAIEQASPARLNGFRLVSDDGASVSGRYANTPFVPYRPFGYALPRYRLDALLLEAAGAAGAAIREGDALEELTLDHGRVSGGVLRGRAGTRVAFRARVTVGADGLQSRVARSLGVARRGRLRRLALVAHLAGVEGMTDLGEMFAARGWYVGLAAVGPDLVNVAMVVPNTDAPAIAAGADDFFLARLREVPELARRLARARIVRPVMSAGPFARRAASAVADGALLVGDAADFYDPFTGEGIFAALRGARLAVDALVPALAAGDASREALAPYAAARRRAFLGKWVLERIVGHGATHPALMRRFTHRLAQRGDVADLWVGAAGDVVPVRALFTPRRLLALV